MDILEFLLNDHVKLQKKMAEIHREANPADLRQKIRALIESYELHELIEEELLFPQLDAALKAQKNPHGALFECSDEHKEMWGFLDKVMDRLNAKDGAGIQQAFFEFSASAEAHMRHEERVLFPAVAELLSKPALEDLAAKAEKRYLRGPQSGK